MRHIHFPHSILRGLLLGCSLILIAVDKPLFGGGLPLCADLQNFSAQYLGAGRGATSCSQAVYQIEFTLEPFDSCQTPSPMNFVILAVDPDSGSDLPVALTQCSSAGGTITEQILAPVFPSGMMRFEAKLVDSTMTELNCGVLSAAIDVPNVSLTLISPSVDQMACTVTAGNTDLSWSIPTHAQYTNIVVERRATGAASNSPAESCQLLPGDSTTFNETLPPLPAGQLGWQYTVIGMMGGDCSSVAGSCQGLPVACELLPTSEAFFDIADMVPGSAGDLVEVPVLLSHSGSFGMVAFGFGVTHDPAVLTPCSPPALQGTALDALSPQPAAFLFNVVDPGGVSVGAIMDPGFPPGNFTPIPLGSDLEIVRLCYQVNQGSTSGETPLQFSTLSPNTTPIQAVCLRPNPTIPGGGAVGIDVDSITSDNGSVLVIGDFVRGDLDGSFTPTVTDVVVLLRFLFPPNIEIGCLDAADVNNDGVTNVTDAIYFLTFTFGAGPPPDDPTFSTFTEADCGPDTTPPGEVPDNLDCMTSFCP